MPAIKDLPLNNLLVVVEQLGDEVREVYYKRTDNATALAKLGQRPSEHFVAGYIMAIAQGVPGHKPRYYRDGRTKGRMSNKGTLAWLDGRVGARDTTVYQAHFAKYVIDPDLMRVDAHNLVSPFLVFTVDSAPAEIKALARDGESTLILASGEITTGYAVIDDMLVSQPVLVNLYRQIGYHRLSDWFRGKVEYEGHNYDVYCFPIGTAIANG